MESTNDCALIGSGAATAAGGRRSASELRGQPRGAVTAILSARRGYDGGPVQFFPDPESFLLVPLRDIFIFATLISFGLYNRQKPEIHKRSMLTAVMAPFAGSYIWHELAAWLINYR